MVTLGELAHDIFVGRPLSRIKVASDAPLTPLVSPRDVGDVLPLVGTLETLQAVPSSEIESARLEVGDVVVTARGLVRAAVVQDEHRGAIAGPNLVIVRLGAGPLPHALAAYLRHPAIQERLQASTRGTATAGFGVGDLRALPLTLPDESELETIRELVVLTDRYALAALAAVEMRRQITMRLVHNALAPERAAS